MMITVRIVISQTKKTIPMNWAQMSPLARTGPTSRLKQRRMTEIDLMMRMTGAVAENLAAVSTNPQVGISTVAAARVLRKATNLAIGLQKKKSKSHDRDRDRDRGDKGRKRDRSGSSHHKSPKKSRR